MALSFSEWKKKKEQDEQGTSESSAPSANSSTQTTSSDGFSQGKSFTEWKAERDKVKTSTSAQEWADSAYALLEEVQQYYSGWKTDENQYNSFQDRASSLLSSADGWRKQYSGNNEAIALVNSYVDALSGIKKYAYNYQKYYSQWDSEDAYRSYLDQQKAYEDMANLDLDAAQREIDGLKDSQLGIVRDQNRQQGAYLERNHAPESTPYGAAFQNGTQADRELYDLALTISGKQQQLNLAQYQQEGERLGAVAQNGDFGKFSGYDDRNKDAVYSYINGADNGVREEMAKSQPTTSYLTGNGQNSASPYAAGVQAQSAQPDREALRVYDYMREDEIAIYNYHYAKDGKEAAERYLHTIREQLNTRWAEDMYKGMEGKTAQEILFGFSAGLNQYASGMDSAFNTEDDYIPQTAYQIASGMVREDLADVGPKLPDWMGGATLGQMGYDAVTTTANMAPSLLTSVVLNAVAPGAGAVVGTGMMGMSAAGNAYQEMLNQGYSKGQARMYSTLVGASEAGLEYLLGGISALGGTSKAVTNMLNGVDNAFLRFSGKFVGSMVSEGFEEGLQEVLTPLFHNMVTYEDKEVNWSEVFYSGLLGAVTGGLMEGPSIIAGEVKTYQTGKKLQAADISAQRLAEIGSTFAADTVAHQLAGRVSEKTGAYTMGRLFNEIGATLTQQNVDDITQALVKEGLPESMAKEKAGLMAMIVDGVAQGEALSDEFVRAMEDDSLLARAVRTTIIDPNATWFQRSKGYNDALMALAQEKANPKASRTNPAEAGAENAPVSDTVDAGAEVGAEAAAEAPAAPKVSSISSIKDGKITLKMEDGTEVDAMDADLDPEDGVIIETIAKVGGISSQDASYLLGMVKANPGVNAQMTALGATEAYRYGYYGMSREHMAEHGAFAPAMSEEMRSKIYETGRNAGKTQVAAKQAAVSQKGSAAQKATGKVHFEGDRSSLTKRQRVSLSAMEKIADALGVQIHVFESKVGKNGKRMGANGWYNPADNSIHIDLHAGQNGEGTMLFTLAHELTHHIRKWSPAKFKILADFLMEEYGKKGVNVDGLIREQMAKAKRGGRTISYDTAYEEVVADSMETMLADGKVMEKLTKLKARDQGLWQKIKDFISELAAKIRSVYEGLSPDSVEGRYVAEMKDSIERLQEMFAEALVDASENYQSAEAQKNTTQEGGEVKMQTRSVKGEQVVWIDENILKSNKNQPVHQFVAEYIAEHIGDVYTIIESGQKVYIGEDLPGEYTQSKYTQMILKKRSGLLKAKNRAVSNFGEMIEIATNRRWEKTKHPESKDAKYGMYRYDTRFGFPVTNHRGESIGANVYRAELLIRNASDGKKYLYDVVSIKKDTTSSDWLTQRVTSAAEKSAGQKGDVSKNNVSQYAEEVKPESVEAVDVEVDTKTESVAPSLLFSERTWTESDYVQARAEAAAEIAKATGVSKKKAMAYIDSVNSIAKMIAEDRSRLDYFSSPGRSSFVGNVEYGGSFDFSTLCKKRRLLTGTFTAIQKALPNTALTANEILDIRNRMKDAGLEVSCGLCYVEGSRANMGQFAKEFLKLYKQYYPDAWQPNMADVNTPDGIEWVRINHPEVYEQYEYFWNHYGTLKPGDKNLFASQQKPKLYQLHTEYKGEILQRFKDDTNVEEKNLNGGIRLQSFSDFEIVHLIDTMQIIMDMSRVGLAGQAYTKVPDFAWALGDTGLKINLSLIAKGVDENGKLIFDDVEGMPIADAMKLRERYSKNVGTILVAFNDAQLLAAMADERVDYIIPFHRSQWKKSQYTAMGLPAKTKDYTYMQNEKFIKPQYHEYRGRMVQDKATNYMPNEYWDFSKSGKENAESYLQMCARNNKRPKFYKLLQNNGDGSYSLKADGSTDGYWKLLIDFKMYDNDGKGSPQMPVKPEFNMDEATRMLKDYQGGHSNFPVAQGIVDDFVQQYKDSHQGAKFSLREDSQGRQLSKGQQEYFRNSKVRDAQGRLQRVFHGTQSLGFTIFDPTKSDDGISLFFSAGKKIARTYSDSYGKKGDTYAIDRNTDLSQFDASDFGAEPEALEAVRKAGIKLLEPGMIRDKAKLDSIAEEIHTEAMAGLEKLVADLESNGYGQLLEEHGYYEAMEAVRAAQTAKDRALAEQDLVEPVENVAWLAEYGGEGAAIEGCVEAAQLATSKLHSAGASSAAKRSASGCYYVDVPGVGKALLDYEGIVDYANAMVGENRFQIKFPQDMGLYECYLNLENPFVLDCGGMLWNELTLENLAAAGNRVDMPGYEGSRTRDVAAWAKEQGYDGVIFKNIVDQGGFSNSWRRKAFDNAAGNKARADDVYVAFSSEQVKSTANTEPTKNPDMRYSDRDTESVSNRSLLVNALEGAAQTDLEKQKLTEYKGKISLIEAEEKKLQELNRQIRELSFAKGPKDKKKLSELRDEATKTANRISIYDKQLLRLEAAKPLQDVLEREKTKAYRRAEQKGKAALAEYREKATRSQRELMTRYQDARKRNVESREKTAMRHKIQHVVAELNSLLLSNDKKRHVPDSLKKAVAEALALVNMDTVGAEERAAKYAKLIAEEQAKANPNQDKIDAYTVSMENILRQGEKMGQRLKELRDAYEEIRQSDDPDIAQAYDPVIAGSLQELAQTIGNTSLRDMTMEQLSDVYDMYRMVLTRVRDANKSFVSKKNESISELASRVVSEVKTVGGENRQRVSALDPVRKFGWSNLKPVYAFEHLGSATLRAAFNGVRKGEDTWAVDVTEARAYYLDKSKKYGYDSWDFKKKHRFESTSGIEFELTLEQILSLYAYSKREQAHDHLRLGGFVFDSNIETYKDGKLLKYKVNTADAHQITIETLTEIIETITPEQKAFVDEMQDYLSTTMGAKGNEVTMQMYGVKLFKEKTYFPLKSAKQFMFEQNEVAGEVRIKNSGFTNKTKPQANNPIILNNFMDVWAGHVNDMSMYHAFVLPLEDFNRIFNYNSPKREGRPPVSVKGAIQNAYSPAAVSYVKNLITDLNGGARSDSTTGIINKMMGLFKKGSVFASLSVVVQQPSAIARAAALVDTKYFIGPKVDSKRHKLLWEEVKKYAPVAIIKEMGYFDTNMGKSTQDFILSKEYSGIKEKMKALVTDSGYRDEILSKAPALADELAWCGIWEAVKREMHHKHPGLDVKSEPFLMLAGSRFTEVITKTQVYDSVLSRSANMRSRDTGMKMATAFMAEPTTSINMIADALLQGKRGNRKHARATIGAVIASQIFNSILVSFVYAGRDDDEDKTYWEKYLGTLTGETIDSLNPMTYIPFVKDIMSIVQGYDVERSDMAIISDLWTAWGKLDNENLSVWRKVEGFAGSIAQLFGLPLKNIMRDVRGIYQTVTSFMNGQPTTKAGIGYAVKESLPGWMGGGDTSKQDQLYEAYMSGDQTQIARVESRYKDESDVDSAMRSAIRERFLTGEISREDAMNQLVTHGGLGEDEAYWKMEEWEYEGETGEDFAKYNEFFAAVQTGRNLRGTVKVYTENGVKESSLKSQMTSHFKPMYTEMTKAERANIKGYLLNAMTVLGDTREEAELTMAKWEYEADHPEIAERISYSAYKRWETEGKPNGVSVEIYTDVYEYRDNGSVTRSQDEVAAYIDNLPISDSQKDALWCCFWKESTLKNAPWH